MSLENDNKNQELFSRISILEEKMDTIIHLLQSNKEKITDIEKSCGKMNGHIDFIENTYDNLKYPINIFKNKIEQVFGKEQKKLM